MNTKHIDTSGERSAVRTVPVLARMRSLLKIAATVMTVGLIATGFTATGGTSVASAQTPTGCNFATGSPGKYADTICWIDFASYNEALALSPTGQPFDIELPGGYRASFDLKTRQYLFKHLGETVPYSTAGMGAHGAFSNHYYQTTGGQPVLWNIGGFPEDGPSSVVWTLDNIVVTGPDGNPISDYKFVSGDAESTFADERITFGSDVELELLEELRTQVNGVSNGALAENVTGLGTTQVEFWGDLNGQPAGVPTQWSSSNLLFASTGPSYISQTIDSGSRNAGVFGFMMSKVKLNKTVESRFNAQDSFDLTVMNGNSQVSSASTGALDEATTGEVSVLASSEITMSEIGGPGTDLDNYYQDWACSVNSIDTPSITPPAGATTLVLEPDDVALSLGDFVECTITNTAKPRNLDLDKSIETLDGKPTEDLRIGDDVVYKVAATNTGVIDYTVTDPARVVDDLAGVLDDADLVESSITATVNGAEVAGPLREGNRLVWEGALPAGETVVLTYVVTLKEGGDRNVKNVAFKGDPDEPEKPTPACDAESPEVVDCEEFNLPKLSIHKTSDVTTAAKPGDIVTYTVTATNKGPGEYTEDSPAAITDDMTGVLDDAIYQGDAVATVNGVAAGSILFESPRLAWSGPLAAGESVALTYTVKLGASGDAKVRNVAFVGDEETPECNADEQAAETCAEVEYPLELPGLLWQKIGDDPAATPLAGSEWSLVPLDKDGTQLSDKALAVLDCVADKEADCAGQADRNPAEGGFFVKPLKAGDYQLVETKAPAGFKLLKDPVNVTISVGNLNSDGDLDLGDIVNEQQDVPAIPLTGGVGTLSILLTAGGIVFAAAVLLIVRARRLRLSEAADIALLS